jgi:hypothetical protein
LLTEREREEYLARGIKVLQKYGVETQSSAKVLYAEKSFSTRLGEIPITGKVDRIDALDELGSTVRIVDYKTGVPKRTLAAVKEDEGLYRQLVFYKILTAHTKGFLLEAKVFALDFIGTDRDGRSLIECEIPEADVLELTSVIEKVWKKICAFDFTPIEK